MTDTENEKSGRIKMIGVCRNFSADYKTEAINSQNFHPTPKPLFKRLYALNYFFFKENIFHSLLAASRCASRTVEVFHIVDH